MDESFYLCACVDHMCSRTLSNGVYFERLHVRVYAYANGHVKTEVYFVLNALVKLSPFTFRKVIQVLNNMRVSE